MDIMELLNRPLVAGNEVWRLLALFAAILLALLLGGGLQFLLRKTAKKQQEKRGMLFVISLQSVSRSIMMVAFSVGVLHGIKFLELSEQLLQMTETASSVLISISVGYVIYCLVDIVDYLLKNLSGKTESKLDDMLVPMVRRSLKVTIVILALVQIADLLSDKPITSVLAGLGVGGLAVALAAQDTLKNFFGSLVILGDKPFELGDRIVVDGHDGCVEEVGFRSTRIRTLDDHLVTIPNGELANKLVKNISARTCIKSVHNITITYDTPQDKVEKALSILRELLDGHAGMNPELPPRIFFNQFNDCSLNILVIYWYHPPNYWDYLAFNETFCLDVFRRFNEAGIDFAFPTQTTFLAGDPNRPLYLGKEV